MVPQLQFHEMGLSNHLLKGIARLGWIKPTAIQNTVIPLILKKKNIDVEVNKVGGKFFFYQTYRSLYSFISLPFKLLGS